MASRPSILHVMKTARSGLCLQLILAFIATLASSRPAVPQMAEETELPFRFGPFTKTVAELEGPTGVAIDGIGHIYIVESTAHRVTVVDRDGSAINQWGSFGSAAGEFRFPSSIDVLGAGDDAYVFVSDTGNDRVQVFRATGRFVRAMGKLGDGPGEFNRPRGITVDNELLFVADEGNDRVQILNHDGTMLREIGFTGMDEGQFNHPMDVDVDDERNIYVADSENNRIQKFLLDGTFVEAWGDYGPFPGLLDRPAAITVQDNRVYVVDQNNHRVQVFSLEGDAIYQWGVHAIRPREGDGVIHYPADLAIAPDGSFAVLCESFEDRCQIFGIAPPSVAEKDAGSPYVPKLNTTHFGTRLSISMNLLAIAEPETHTVYMFRIEDEVPALVSQITGRGRKPHEFTRLTDLDIRIPAQSMSRGGDETTEKVQDNPLINLLVTDIALSRIQQFTLGYDPREDLVFRPHISKLQRTFDLNYFSETIGERGLKWTIEPAAIKRDAQENIWMCDPRNRMVHVFDAQMKHLRSMGGEESDRDRSRLREPIEVSFSRDGAKVYIVDRADRIVKVFDTNGEFVRPIYASEQGASALFAEPYGVASGVDGFIYITDAGANSVTKYDESYKLKKVWGTRGSDDGQFWKPGEIEQAPDGRLFIADYGNHRAQIFSPDGEWLVTFGLGKPMTRERKERQSSPETEVAE